MNHVSCFPAVKKIVGLRACSFLPKNTKRVRNSSPAFSGWSFHGMSSTAWREIFKGLKKEWLMIRPFSSMMSCLGCVVARKVGREMRWINWWEFAANQNAVFTTKVSPDWGSEKAEKMEVRTPGSTVNLLWIIVSKISILPGVQYYIHEWDEVRVIAYY
jgi:hypothetical protein